MPKNVQIFVTAILIVALLGAGTAWAQAYGRLTVRVKDPDGQPISDASITVTSEELPSFRVETKTKKKGQTTIAFGDATKAYTMKVEKEGFEPVELVVKPGLRDTAEQEVVLSQGRQEPDAAATVPQAEAGRLSPSEELFNEGVELLQGGDLNSAAAKFREAIAKNDKLAPAHSALSAVYLEQGEYDQAIAAAMSFLSLSPDHPTGYRVLYDAYRALGRDQEAEEALAKLTSLGDSGDYAILMYNEGVEALKSGQTDVAKARFEEALEGDPQLTAAMVALGQLSLAQGDLADAAARADAAIALEPQNFSALMTAYQAYSGLGDAEKAGAAFDSLAAGDPKRVAKLFYDKGVQSFNAGAGAAAIESFERALAADPELAKAHFHLGIAQVNAGRTVAAKEHLRKFLEMAPDDPEAGTAREMLDYLGN